MTRRELREHIFRLLFLAEFYEGQELHEQTELYLDKLKTAQEKDLVYLREKTEADSSDKGNAPDDNIADKSSTDPDTAGEDRNKE